MVTSDKEKCIKCMACVEDCVVNVLERGEDGSPVMTEEKAKYCINCQHCLAVCPAGAIVCNGVTAEECSEIKPLPSPESVSALLRQRRSIRKFKNENVPPEIMTKLKDALAWSPTGCNDRRTLFRIVDDAKKMTPYREGAAKMLRTLIKTGIMRLVYPNYKRYLAKILSGEDVIFRNAPHMIVAAVHKDAPCREADPWIALDQFDVLCQAYGIGTCWCGFAVYALKFNGALKRLLDLPKGYRISSVMLFGPPDVRYFRTTKPEKPVILS